MNRKVSFNTLNSILYFQRRFRFIKNEIETINNRVVFFRDIVMSMLNNLNYLNSVKIFQNTKSHNILILEEIREIKEILDKFTEKITFSTLKRHSLNELNMRVLNINNLIIKYFNHISPENIKFIS